jgi:hypothetical protein
MISFTVGGSFSQTEAILQKMAKLNIPAILNRHGQEGVRALASATPTESGLAANSWNYEVTNTASGVSITWTNHDIENGFPVAIMLQFGYSTGTGGYVHGTDYINPAMRPIFDRISEEVWKAVIS